jgi:hypothetical protein
MVHAITSETKSTLDSKWSNDQWRLVDAFWAREGARLSRAAQDPLPWSGGVARRDNVASSVRAERLAQGFLTKPTFDEVMRWGFKRPSSLAQPEIETATRQAFSSLEQGDSASAVNALRGLTGIGVSRATKVLALSDQANLGIYDSHAAAALQSIRVGGKPLVPIPPGRWQTLTHGSYVSQAELADHYPVYLDALRRLLLNAQQDPRYAREFKTVADVERALFGLHLKEQRFAARQIGLNAAIRPVVRDAAFAALVPVLLGGGRDLLDGRTDPGVFAKRRGMDAAQGVGGRVLSNMLARLGRAESALGTHALHAGRGAAAGVILGSVVELPALVGGGMTVRDFLENRGLDAGSSALQYGGGALASAALIAAPFEAPAIVAAGAVVLAGTAASFATAPLRGLVHRGRAERAARERRERLMQQRRGARRN